MIMQIIGGSVSRGHTEPVINECGSPTKRKRDEQPILLEMNANGYVIRRGDKMDIRRLRRAVFVYEAARLEAIISERSIIPRPWREREEEFKSQFIEVVDKQCSGNGFSSAEEAHNSWLRDYERLGWKYGRVYDPDKKVHPDMVPFNELPKSERDKDEIFLRLCAVAEMM